ncbi:unnamed protein product [Boreogadus saida]
MASCCYNLRDWDLFPTTENEKADQNKTDDIALIGIVEELHSCGCDPGLDGFWDLEGAPRTHVTRAPPYVGPAVYIEPARGLQLHSVTGQCSLLPPPNWHINSQEPAETTAIHWRWCCCWH